MYDRNEPFDVASYAPVDFKKAAYWYKKAADQGNQWAQNDLGYLYYTGQGVKQDFNRAAELFLMVSKQETRAAKEAMANLGTLYLNGKGVKQNFDSAAYWYTKAAKVGNTEAQAKIGYLYLKGLGIPLDKKKGYDWLEMASRNHNEYAQLDLALLTATGQGTTKNPNWALYILKVLSETSTDEIVKQRAKIYAQDIRQSNPNASATNPWEVFSKSNHQNHKESLSAGEVLLGLVLLNAALDDGKSNANHDPWDDIKRQQEESQRNVWRIQEEINIWCPPGPIGGR